MQVENPQFLVTQSLRSQRKIKRTTRGSVFEVREIMNLKKVSALKRSSTMLDTKPEKIDLSKEKEQVAVKRKTSHGHSSPFNVIRFASKLKLRKKMNSRANETLSKFKQLKKQSSKRSFQKLGTISNSLHFKIVLTLKLVSRTE